MLGKEVEQLEIFSSKDSRTLEQLYLLLAQWVFMWFLRFPLFLQEIPHREQVTEPVWYFVDPYILCKSTNL